MGEGFHLFYHAEGYLERKCDVHKNEQSSQGRRRSQTKAIGGGMGVCVGRGTAGLVTEAAGGGPQARDSIAAGRHFDGGRGASQWGKSIGIRKGADAVRLRLWVRLLKR
jgi:hypothetical protein